VLIVRTPTSIPILAGPVRPRILESTSDYEHLAEFTVGEEKQSEREVMTVVKAAVEEVASPAPKAVPVRRVVALEATSGSWVGVSVVRPRGKPPFAGIPYIEAIGTARGYRKCRLCDELTRPGTALLLGTVEAVSHLAGCPQAPPAMSAWVLPWNKSSHLMFDAVGFERRLAGEVGCLQDVRVREAGRRLTPQLPSAVYRSLTDERDLALRRERGLPALRP